jgi:hypothetical protein
MDVFVVVCCTAKDKRQSQDNQAKEVQIKYREQKKREPGDLFPGIKWPGSEADNILLVSSLRISGVTPLLLIHAFYGVHREFYFHFCCTF